MFSVLDGVENFSEWISNGPIGWVILNPLFLAIAITLIIIVLHEMYKDEDDDKSLTKFIVYSFLAVLIPIIINNNAIDRKVMNGSYDVSVEDFDSFLEPLPKVGGYSPAVEKYNLAGRDDLYE